MQTIWDHQVFQGYLSRGDPCRSNGTWCNSANCFVYGQMVEGSDASGASPIKVIHIPSTGEHPLHQPGLLRSGVPLVHPRQAAVGDPFDIHVPSWTQSNVQLKGGRSHSFRNAGNELDVSGRIPQSRGLLGSARGFF